MENCKKLTKYYNEITKILREHLDDSDIIGYNEKTEILDVINDTLEMYFDEVPDYKLIETIVDMHFSNEYKFVKNLDHSQGDACFREFDIKYKIDEVNNNLIKIPNKYKNLEDQFQKLYNLPQPEQRSKAWFDLRYNMITASDIATALGENPYEPPEGLIIKKCDPDFPFLDNKFVHHGKKYEPTATMIYEHIYNVKVTEFGCLKDPKISFLGASPDGICSKSTLDNKFSPLLGRMLEIKCPFSREIKTEGLIDGDICPHYYYCQVQIQEQCCELEDCDFWQCKLVEYENRNEYLKDINPKTKHTVGNKGEEIDINPLIKKGCILQFLPKNKLNEFCLFDAKYLYPPRLDLTVEEYDKWVMDTLATWKVNHPDLEKDFIFDTVIYWKMPKSHNVLIKRDREWFKAKYPILKKFWKRVQDVREDDTLLKNIQIELEKEKKKKYFKYNTEIQNMSEYYTKKGILFLNPSTTYNSDEELDIDLDEDLFID